MLSIRSTLPVFNHRSKILSQVATNRVTIVMGQTGSGKSTQVPQLLLDACLAGTEGSGSRDGSGLGSTTHILCTQPRRLSATGLAERVAAERGEKCGETVGYRIRLESKVSHKTRYYRNETPRSRADVDPVRVCV